MDLPDAQASRTAGELTALGAGTAYPFAADLAEPERAEQIHQAARRVLPSLDGAVLSVGGPPSGTLADSTEADWRAAFEQVFLGPLRMARLLVQSADRPQAITAVLSTSVRTPLPDLAISNGLRPGLAMALKTLADEFGPQGHRVNGLLPGRYDTDRVRALEAATGDPEAARADHAAAIPLRRLGDPAEFGAVAAFVTSPRASYLTGSLVTVDGGQTRTL